jgi:hypothetical protein
MNIIRRTLEIDAGTDARLTQIAARRGQDGGSCRGRGATRFSRGAGGPDIAEDRRRLDEFLHKRETVALDDAKARVANWDLEEELPPPSAP